MVYAVGMCVDERYLLPALVTIGSLADALSPAARRETALRVLALDISRGHAETMAAYARDAGFGSFDLRWGRPPQPSALAEASYITVTTYLRFSFTLRFLARPYLVYLDADVLVLGDLSAPLADIARSGAHAVGMVADEFNPHVGTGTALPGLAERRPELRGRPYYNAGALWTHTGMLAAMRTGVVEALRHGWRHIHHNDQDALNLWLLRSAPAVARVLPVPGRYNRFELGRFLERSDWVRRVVARPAHSGDAEMIHFVGPIKPWMPSCPGTADVLLYRDCLALTTRRLRRLGDLGISLPAASR